MIIYKITNKINGKVYIGQTIQPLKKRWNLHCSKNSGCPALNNAFKKYGKENFTIEQIDHAHSRDELDNKEIFWIDFYSSLVPNGYNLHTGGLHHKVSEETRKRIIKSLIGRKHTEETKRRISEAQKGEKHHFFGTHFSKEHREKMSNALKGNKRRLGIPHSEETKKRIAEYGKRKVINVDTGIVFDSAKEAGLFYGICPCNITEVCRGHRKTARNYRWRYADE